MDMQRSCWWCGEKFEQLDPDYWFCQDECAKASLELRNCKQRNCQWCYKRIETRVLDLYCSETCNKHHVRFQTLSKQRSVFTWVLYWTGILGCLASVILFLQQPKSDVTAGMWAFALVGIYHSILSLTSIRDAWIEVIQSNYGTHVGRYLGYTCVCSSFGVGNYDLFIKNFCCAGKKCEHDFSIKDDLYSSLAMGALPLCILLSLVGVCLVSLDPGLELVLAGCLTVLVAALVSHLKSHVDEHRFQAIGMTKNQYESMKIAGRVLFSRFIPGNQVLESLDNYFSMTPDELINKSKEKVLEWFEQNRKSEVTYYRLQKELQGKLVCNVHDVKVLPQNVYDFYVKVENLSDRDVTIVQITVSGKSRNVTETVSAQIQSGQSKVVHFRHRNSSKLPKLKNVTVDVVSVEQYESWVWLSSESTFYPYYDNFLKLIGHERQIPA